MQSHVLDNPGSLKELFTLVLITHNRNAFLRRTLEYYRGFTGRLLVLDSSDQGDSALSEQYPFIDYHHLPQLSYGSLQEKLAYGSSVVTTPFMAFAPDDDFMLHDALAQCVAFLQANPDYGMCHGYGMMYLARGAEVLYFRREMKVQEDYGSDCAAQRVMDFMAQFLPPFYAVTRTELLRSWHRSMPAGVSFEWQEVGHSFYLLASAKARILDIPYIVREINYGGSDHSTNVLTVLAPLDAQSVAGREEFAAFLTSLPTGISELEPGAARQLALDSFAAMADCLLHGRSLRMSRIFRSQWQQPGAEPVRHFDLIQFVEMPFYNKAFFDRLTEIEFLIHSMPANRQQMLELEGVLVQQQELMQQYPNDTQETLRARLWRALSLGVFNLDVVDRLIPALQAGSTPEELDEAENLKAWAQRVRSVAVVDRKAMFDNMHSGRLIKWLDDRRPTVRQVGEADRLLQQSGPQIEILLLDLDNDADALQATFDSLLASNLKTFKVVVLMTGDLPANTRRKDTVHFVKVKSGRHVEQLNELAAGSSADWLLLAKAGEVFTATGLLRAALELRAAPECRAVAMDEVHRQEDGSLRDVLRPGFNLDLLLSVPDLMAGHWLIRRDVFLEAGGYSARFAEALEFDLVLRLIEGGGMSGLAHLAEPLLICKAPERVENEQQSQTLVRHLEVRGYQAQVSSTRPGNWQIDYRHARRPLVSIILRSEDNFEVLQLCLISVLQRTRYQQHEILIADNHSRDPRLHQWLDELQAKGERIRTLRLEQGVNTAALYNLASQQARGEYLLFLAPDAQVVTANWVDSLLNQAQRPEVAIVGAKLVDSKGVSTQAGLLLGQDNGVAAAFVGEGKDSPGYMDRALVEQNCSAVSWACMMVRKELFDAAGGFDEVAFGQGFADVDLCLKLGEAGYLTVLTPQAQVLHSGEVVPVATALDALRSKWSGPLQQDPLGNENHLHSQRESWLKDGAVDWDQLLG
ncbi:TIGR00180 family glycosyltransferase [Pseudomonas sp. LJDD11]|uniref:TIGR00180 family glycosyltransferase n=1 Tax=unclassified Pseudomonas TaxID=196821 RepID=UPI0004F6961E|nr:MULTISPECIES: TIGR00180 family glycosyltransferase [unclassified Pseudomonas]MCQ9424909.1 TIGR00180 family glycosyltransferase [Pseudomonas sp. LJDD11]BAP44165.1 glycosyltransferase, group 2 family [Pseudomonas sp. StFLB209]